MKCGNCDREFATPLEIYNGKLYCPHCKKLCTMEIALDVTEQSEEEFRMGELFYKKALVASDDKSRSAYEKKSKELILSSAHSGHPMALLRLGYMYYSGFMVADSKVAVTLADNYFRNVWKGKYSEKLSGYVHLREIAAAQHLEMLAAQGAYEEVELAKKEMIAANVKLSDDVLAGMHAEAQDAKMDLTQALDSCVLGIKKPIFGIVSIKGGEFKQWAKTDCLVKGNPVKTIKKYIDQKINMKYVYTRPEEADEGTLRDIDASVAEELANGKHAIADGAGLAVYFFNAGNCSRKYKGIERLIQRNYYRDLFRMVNGLDSQRRDIIVREDDIIFYKSDIESVQHAFSELVDDISSKN